MIKKISSITVLGNAVSAYAYINGGTIEERLKVVELLTENMVVITGISCYNGGMAFGVRHWNTETYSIDEQWDEIIKALGDFEI